MRRQDPGSWQHWLSADMGFRRVLGVGRAKCWKYRSATSAVALLWIATAGALWCMASSTALAQSRPATRPVATHADPQAQAPDAAPAAEALQAMRDHYASGRFEEADQSASALLTRELTRAQEAEVVLTKARLSYVFNKDDAMLEWLRRLHQTEPHAQVDPLRDPPELVEAWRELQRANPGGLADTEDILRKESRFWILLAPLGIGHFDANRHRDGLVFLSSEVSLLALLALQSPLQDSRTTRNLHGMASAGLLGLWSLEVWDRMEVMRERDADKAQSVRYWLSFAPFGVAQLKNGDTEKALGVAGIQAASLAVWVLGPKGAATNLGRSLFYVSWLYGAYDGWARHRTTAGPASVQIAPHVSLAGRHTEVGAALAWRF